MSRWSYYLPILGYHKVGPLKGDHVPTVTPATFARQMAFLARCRYRVISLAEAVDCVDHHRPWPRHRVVLTFDDGYLETSTIVWPLLRRYGFCATTFVATAEIGLPGFLTWEQVTAMARDGMTIGSHTMHHSYLPSLAQANDRLAVELVESKRVIEERVGHAVGFISYPIGGFTPEAQRMIQAAGYRAACTTNRLSPRGRVVDRFALRRIKVTERDRSMLLFCAKLSGHYDAFRTLHQPG